jgi:ABC-type glycerol-3-phosphate transport system substrate-binding protein
VFVHETPQDPLQQRVDAAMAALHRGDEDPQAAADAVEKKQKAAK